LGRSGTLWKRARAKCLSSSNICWICAGECPDFKWPDGELPFGTAAIDMSLRWPHPASASVDHEIPISQLDKEDPRLWQQQYLHPAHLKCNSARGDGTRKVGMVPTITSRNWLA